MRINITIPVYNEEAQLAASIEKLVVFCSQHVEWPFEVVIADNASTDSTFRIARELSDRHQDVRAVHLDRKGRGRAVKHVWLSSDADILCYMDVDLSTDLEAFPALVGALVENRYELATGSRLLPGSKTTRSLRREVISRAYNFLVKGIVGASFSDAQCGFKAITRQAAMDLLPLVEDTGWFMDTELLVLAEKRGHRILDLPVRWVEDPDSRVKILSTALHDLRGLIRLRRRLARQADWTQRV
jgi:glycosyltransferase involved in cell wall biosynthesis